MDNQNRPSKVKNLSQPLNPSSPSSDTSFYSNDITTIIAFLQDRRYKSKIERNNALLDLIRLKQPISKYELAKLSGVSYTSVRRICKEFEFCDLIGVKNSWSENNIPVKLVYIKPEHSPGDKQSVHPIPMENRLPQAKTQEEDQIKDPLQSKEEGKSNDSM